MEKQIFAEVSLICYFAIFGGLHRLTIETILWLDNLNGNMTPKIFWDVKRDINLTKLFSKRNGGKEQTMMISVAM